MIYTLPARPYVDDALEPDIDRKTMEIHHRQYHPPHTNNMNVGIAGTAWEDLSVNLD